VTTNVYVASSWRNPAQPEIVQAIRKLGMIVYDFRNPGPGKDGFSWSEIDPDWQDWTAEQYVAALEHPRAVEGYTNDFIAMNEADTFVLVLPCGRSAHLELGWAVGAGKRTAILLNGDHEPELMVKMVDHIATSMDDLATWLTTTSPYELWQNGYNDCLQDDMGKSYDLTQPDDGPYSKGWHAADGYLTGIDIWEQGNGSRPIHERNPYPVPEGWFDER
jgi:hypothetical protein